MELDDGTSYGKTNISELNIVARIAETSSEDTSKIQRTSVQNIVVMDQSARQET